MLIKDTPHGVRIHKELTKVSTILTDLIDIIHKTDLKVQAILCEMEHTEVKRP